MKTKSFINRIAYLGIPGSYSYCAGISYFGRQNIMIQTSTIFEVFDKVEKGLCQFGVVPIENSTTGSITETYDQFLKGKAYMVGETFLKIHHHLMGHKAINNFSKLTVCYSHPVALQQCSEFLKAHPNLKPRFADDTASAVKLVSESHQNLACAIGSKVAADFYRLKIIKYAIEDYATNMTRFAIIGKSNNPSGNKLTLMFTLKHEPGSLVRALESFAKMRLNLTKIESRPNPDNPWEYLFIMDFEIGKRQKEAFQAIRSLNKEVVFQKSIGVYMKGKTYET